MLAAAVLVGVAGGLGGYTFVYAKGASYLTNDPAACANCHVMNEQYSGWLKSSHRAVAVCNDCHTPHGVRRQVLRPRRATASGTRSAFTTGDVPRADPRSRPRNRAITEANCRRCHAPVVQAMGTPSHAGSDAISCIRCHGSVGHLELFATNVAQSR